MITTNRQFSEKEMTILKSLVGKKFHYACRDAEYVQPYAFFKVGFGIGGKFFLLTCDDQPVDMWEGQDIWDFLSFRECEERDIHLPKSDGREEIKVSVEDTIEDVIVITDEIIACHGDERQYNLTYVPAIVFVFKGHQIVYWMNSLSQPVISILKGENAMSLVPPIDESWGEGAWNEGYSSINRRVYLKASEYSAK